MPESLGSVPGACSPSMVPDSSRISSRSTYQPKPVGRRRLRRRYSSQAIGAAASGNARKATPASHNSGYPASSHPSGQVRTRGGVTGPAPRVDPEPAPPPPLGRPPAPAPSPPRVPRHGGSAASPPPAARHRRWRPASPPRRYAPGPGSLSGRSRRGGAAARATGRSGPAAAPSLRRGHRWAVPRLRGRPQPGPAAGWPVRCRRGRRRVRRQRRSGRTGRPAGSCRGRPRPSPPGGPLAPARRRGWR